MANLLRYFQKIFGINAGSNQMAEYGSLIGDPPGNLYDGATITPDIVQNLSQFESGQYAAVGGANSPTIQDHNSLFYLYSYQLAYLFQKGIPDWNAETTYFIGNIVRVSGVNYVSLVNNNLNNAVSDDTKWRLETLEPISTTYTSGSGTYVTSATVAPLYLRIRAIGAGGGGAGSGTGVSVSNNGGNGGDTTFSTITAGGGKGADMSVPGDPIPGAGGTGSVGAGAIEVLNVQGGAGGDGMVHGGIAALELLGGAGGCTPLSSTSAIVNSAGLNGVSNTGAGGGGGAGSSSSPYFYGAGGGGGNFIEAYILNPGISTSFSFSVGTGGTLGLAGVSGFNGGTGASGIIIVEEFYQ